METLDYTQIKNFIEDQPDGTKVYIGCDSERFKYNKVWHADFALVVVVHIGGKHGAKIFGEVQRQRDYDKKLSKPRFRLMTEVYLVADLYLKLVDLMPELEIEVHLDINPNELHGSSCVVYEAIGYVKGVCNVTPLIKPEAWAASTCADRGKRLFKKSIVSNLVAAA